MKILQSANFYLKNCKRLGWRIYRKMAIYYYYFIIEVVQGKNCMRSC